MKWTHKPAKGNETIAEMGKGEAVDGGSGRRINEYHGRHNSVKSPETALE